MAEGINWLSLVGLALLGVVFVSIAQLIDLLRYRLLGTMTTGTVARLEQETMSDDSYGFVFTPAVEYEVGGEHFSIKSVIAMSPALYKTGQSVPVYYFPANPGNGRVVTGREFVKWFVVIASCLVFLAFFIAAERSPADP